MRTVVCRRITAPENSQKHLEKSLICVSDLIEPWCWAELRPGLVWGFLTPACLHLRRFLVSPAQTGPTAGSFSFCRLLGPRLVFSSGAESDPHDTCTGGLQVGSSPFDLHLENKHWGAVKQSDEKTFVVSQQKHSVLKKSWFYDKKFRRFCQKISGPHLDHIRTPEVGSGPHLADAAEL